MLAPERWARIRTLLEEVEGLPAADREAYLARTCVDEPEVRAEVESLLRAGAAGDGFLDPADGPPLLETNRPEPVLEPGTRLDGFEILGPLGAGGMGRVYRARDTNLGRTVALKVLAPNLADDTDSQSRFEREARILSQLNHPHICVLHEAGRATLDGHGDVRYLVMELVNGETLAERLARGPLPVDRVLEYATQIAEALDAAHRQGIVHRDLKPANVVLTKAAGVKLLDFGLARLRPPAGAPTATTVVHDTLTQRGMVAGTLPYMSPEQVRGEEADARSDVFAFGAVLYEMLAGRRPFDAETPTALMVQILERDPPALAERAPHVPVALDRLIRTCLAKDPADRWQHAHDVVLALREIRERDRDVPEQTSHRSSRWLWAAVGVAAVTAVIAVAAWNGRPPAPGGDMPRVLADLALPAGFVPGAFNGQPRTSRPVISPDGQRLAIVGRWGGPPQVWIRAMDGPTLTPVPGTEDAQGLFWAPDSERIGFASRGSLRTVAVSGGPVQTLYDGLPPLQWSATWGSQGVIVFAEEGRLHRIAELGGTPQPLMLESGGDGIRYSGPSFLPDGRRFLVVAGGPDTHGIWLGSLDYSKFIPLLEDDGAWLPHYAAGHLLVLRQGDLIAMPFDVRTAAPTGSPRTLVALNGGQYTASAGGTVVARSDQPRELGFRMPDGTRTATLGANEFYRQVALSTSGTRAAVVKRSAEQRDETWIVDLTTSAWTRLDPRVGGSSQPTHMSDPAWGPDDRRLVFTSGPGDRGFFRDLSTGADQLIADLPPRYIVDDWTRDGSLVVFRSHEEAGSGVWVRAVAPGAPETQRVLWRPSIPVDQVQVSPDGRWVAYHAWDSGALNVYVARFPSFTDAQQVSASRGGVQPIWAHDGQRLFYLMLDGTMMAVDLRRDGDRLTADAPRALFATRLTNPSSWVSEYDVTHDGRFLIIEREPGPYTLTVLMNWAPAGP